MEKTTIRTEILNLTYRQWQNIKKIENDLMEKLGLKTHISNKKNNKGSVTFDYKDLDQLNRLIEIIKKYY